MLMVEVPAEDLERLLFGAAAIKTIENALNVRKNDPFTKPHLDFSEAHNRLNGHLLRAKRSANPGGTVVGWDDPLTDREAAYLFAHQLPHWHENTGDVQSGDVVTSLLAKGCLHRGTAMAGIRWDGTESADWKPLATTFALKVSERGRQRLEEYRQAHPT